MTRYLSSEASGALRYYCDIRNCNREGKAHLPRRHPRGWVGLHCRNNRIMHLCPEHKGDLVS